MDLNKLVQVFIRAKGCICSIPQAPASSDFKILDNLGWLIWGECADSVFVSLYFTNKILEKIAYFRISVTSTLLHQGYSRKPVRIWNTQTEVLWDNASVSLQYVLAMIVMVKQEPASEYWWVYYEMLVTFTYHDRYAQYISPRTTWSVLRSTQHLLPMVQSIYWYNQTFEPLNSWNPDLDTFNTQIPRSPS